MQLVALIAAGTDYGKAFSDWFVSNAQAIWGVVAIICAFSIALPGIRKPSIIGTMFAVLFVTGAVVFAGPAIADIIKALTNRFAKG